jgi:integrase
VVLRVGNIPKDVQIRLTSFRKKCAARKHSRYGHRDATAILIAYRHGLRASELCELTWNTIELDSGRIHVRRAKTARTPSQARRSGPFGNDGVDTRALQHFLGHRNIMHTVRYTELRSDRFDGFWKD